MWRWLVNVRELPRHRFYAAWLSGPLAVAFGTAAHLVAGQAVPGVSVLLALAALLSMGSAILARVNPPVWVLLLVSGVVQQVLHLTFAGLSLAASGASSGHVHVPFSWEPPQAGPAVGGHAALELMLDAHVAAALMTVLVITQSRMLVSWLPRLRRTPVPPQPRP
jgi:hypothetical protein